MSTLLPDTSEAAREAALGATPPRRGLAQLDLALAARLLRHRPAAPSHPGPERSDHRTEELADR
ncbi:hypothetical protein [Nocardioides marmotae]|uniref:hypothetical protein n=1 Tax=Nocardioides marmotae TaxID=2663857 RepID=UPI0012B6789C|nr:hypothetical protein [Nocardioides marmotae]MBC9733489.1 hypothetical protein [Nocardioides marmotae]MTB84596.1 hypothetical protein [Nocardioides marmotae]